MPCGGSKDQCKCASSQTCSSCQSNTSCGCNSTRPAPNTPADSAATQTPKK